MPSSPKPPHDTIYYDGDCPMCSVIVDTIGHSGKASAFTMHDFQKGILPEGVSREDVDREIYVVGEDGAVFSNIDAVFKILESYPYARPLLPLLRFAPVKALLRGVYNLVARNRKWLFRKRKA